MTTSSVLLRVAPFLAALLFITAAVPAFVDAESAGDDVGRFVGRYRYSKSEKHGRAVIQRAFEPAIEQLDIVTRTVARRKLRRTNTLTHTIGITREGQSVAVEYIGEKTFRVSSPLGVKTKVKAPNGNEVDLTQHIDGDSLVQVFVGPKGTTTNHLTLSDEDRTLTYHSVIRGAKLTTPITIRLVYRRQ